MFAIASMATVTADSADATDWNETRAEVAANVAMTACARRTATLECV
jgi:hypothetical protein